MRKLRDTKRIMYDWYVVRVRKVMWKKNGSCLKKFVGVKVVICTTKFICL